MGEKKNLYHYTWDLEDIVTRHLVPGLDDVEIHQASASADEGTLSLAYSRGSESDITGER